MILPKKDDKKNLKAQKNTKTNLYSIKDKFHVAVDFCLSLTMNFN